MTPLEQLWAAVNVEGPVPRYHREVMARHRAEWPVLWEAIDRLLADRRMKLLDEIYSFRSVAPAPEWLEAIEEAKAAARGGGPPFAILDEVAPVTEELYEKLRQMVADGRKGSLLWDDLSASAPITEEAFERGYRKLMGPRSTRDEEGSER